jgi:CRP/FNR family transcriptional regulator, cyclic AMP receptor protein
MQTDTSVNYLAWGADNIAYGPVELPGLVTWVKQGKVTANSWVIKEKDRAWSRASELAELKLFFKSKLPPSEAATAEKLGIQPGALRRIKILADLDERQLVSFLQYLEVMKLLPNATVFKKGDHGDAMFLVLMGELRARVMVGGQESTLAVLAAGECFGEMAVLDEGPRSADVVANTECMLLKISAGALKKVFQEAPALAAPFLLGLSKTISSRVRTLTKRYEDSILFARTAKQAT